MKIFLGGIKFKKAHRPILSEMENRLFSFLYVFYDKNEEWVFNESIKDKRKEIECKSTDSN